MAYMSQGSTKTKLLWPINTKTGKPVNESPVSSGGSSSSDDSFYDDLSDILDASKITQERASADRQTALAEISSAREKALAEYGNVSPEVISEKTQEMMMGKARDTAEAERASMLRQLQASYYTGSMPSGALLQKASDIDLAKMGTLASARRDIMTGAAEKNWTAKYNLAASKAGVHTGLTPTTVDVLSNTIAAVPQISKPTTTTTTTTSKNNTYGRLSGEMNVDFLRRDPAGYKKWYDATYGGKTLSGMKGIKI